MGQRRHRPGHDRDRDAPQLAVDRLDLAGVQTRPDLDPEGLDTFGMAWAQRIPRAGPSNVAKNASPAVSTSLPRYLESIARTMA
jgi:hypothetical protein